MNILYNTYSKDVYRGSGKNAALEFGAAQILKLFKYLTDEEGLYVLRAIKKNVQFRKFKKNEYLIVEGEEGPRFYLSLIHI